MPDCFISYKREDEALVAPLVLGLRDDQLDLWWDRDIPGGQRWRETIEQQLDASRCVIVCWTERSTGPEGAFVREEAERAKARGVLLPVLLESVTLPFGFGEVQALDLRDWNGDRNDPRWAHFVATVRALIAGGPRPKAHVPRRPRWPAILSSAAIVLVGLVGFINDVAGLQSMLCKSDSGRGACRAIGIGNIASLDEETAWKAALTRNEANGYREYLGQFAKGEFVAEAQARLAACKNEKVERWKPVTLSPPLSVPRARSASPDEARARLALLPVVEKDARTLACGGFASSHLHRLSGVKVPDEGWRCERGTDGWQCGFDGVVVCELEERTTVEVERCAETARR